jgi:hypothetical protein
MNDTTHRGTSDSRLISVKETYELRHWKKHFGCTAQELMDAVAAVGNDGAEIGAYIALHHPVMSPNPSDARRVA